MATSEVDIPEVSEIIRRFQYDYIYGMDGNIYTCALVMVDFVLLPLAFGTRTPSNGRTLLIIPSN